MTFPGSLAPLCCSLSGPHVLPMAGREQDGIPGHLSVESPHLQASKCCPLPPSPLPPGWPPDGGRVVPSLPLQNSLLQILEKVPTGRAITRRLILEGCVKRGRAAEGGRRGGQRAGRGRGSGEAQPPAHLTPLCSPHCLPAGSSWPPEAEPRPRGCSGLGEPRPALPSF